MSVEMMTKMIQNETATNHRCIYENDDICVLHKFYEFASGDQETVMMVSLKKDGLLWRTETGATPLK